MNHSIYKEYNDILQKKINIENQLSLLPNGYISKKNIRGVTQYYLQRRSGGKVTSKFINANEVEKIRKGLEQRKSLSANLLALNERLNLLENAAKLVSYTLYTACLRLKMSQGMDTIDSKHKLRCSSFASAMNAIEGVHITEETKISITAWQKGETSFMTVFNATLKRYGFPVEV